MIGVSEITQERFGIIRDEADAYTPNESVLRAIGKKSVILLVGPSVTGKSYLTNELVTRYSNFSKVRTITTRDPRPDDTTDTVTCLEWGERDIRRICNTIDSGDGVQYVFHPKTGDIYGTTVDSYPAKYNVLPALSTSISAFDSLPFKKVTTIGVVAPPLLWDEWFQKRGFTAEETTKRAGEALLCLEWLQEHPDIPTVSNIPHATDSSVRVIHDIATGNTPILPVTQNREAIEQLRAYIQEYWQS